MADNSVQSEPEEASAEASATVVEEVGTKRPRETSDEDPTSKLENKPKKNVINGEEGHDTVVILDAGAQYGKVIDRRIRELYVESIMLPLQTPFQDIMKYNPRGIIINGSGDSVTDEESFSCDPSVFTSGIPVLGICYGFQLITKHFGGKVGQANVREDGQFEVLLNTKSSLFESMNEKEMVLLTHGDSVLKLPDNFKPIGWSGSIIIAGQHIDKPIYGVQFHPEVDLSVNGQEVFKTFLYKICGCQGTFRLESREEGCIEYIRKIVGQDHVLSLVSGGVDSAVCTALLFKALDQGQVTAIHINTGYMRKEETKQVEDSLKSLGIDLIVRNESLNFMNAVTMMKYAGANGVVKKQATPFLHMATNAEEKRHIIGDKFIEIAEEIMESLNKKTNRKVFLAQGTLRPDLIESASSLASSNAHVIKTHHNDTTLVRELRSKGLIVEPLKDFHKDEVRRLGRALGLCSSIVDRHPFPGPGLAIRVICQDEPYIDDNFKATSTIVNLLVNFNAKFSEESNLNMKLVKECVSDEDREFLLEFTKSANLVGTLLPIHTVGVQGDSRSYKYVVALSSDDVPNWSQVMKLAKIIPRICKAVNRVAWVFGKSVSHPVLDITPTHLSKTALSTLRQADFVAHSILKYSGCDSKISQMPVVLIPIHFDRNIDLRPLVPSCQRSIVIRPFITQDFMTGVAAVPDQQIPFTVLQEIVSAVEQIPGISRVLYDLTSKPPGTTEWE